MKPSIALNKSYTVEGLSSTHCSLLLALLSNFRLNSANLYGIAALELIQVLEELDTGTDTDVCVVAVVEKDDVVVSEMLDFVLEVR